MKKNANKQLCVIGIFVLLCLSLCACNSKKTHKEEDDIIRNHNDVPEGEGEITKEEALAIVKWNCFGSKGEVEGHTFSVDDIVLDYYYPVIVTDETCDYGGTTYYLVTIDGTDILTADYDEKSKEYILHEDPPNYMNPFEITEDEAADIAKKYLEMERKEQKYSLLCEEPYYYNGVIYYPIKVSFDYGGHTSYSGEHIFVSVKGDDILEGTYGTDRKYEILE